jgi:GrpB-like predicted nucleotidyltransferase (UPF0157 family)
MTPQEPQDRRTWPAWATERVKVVDYDPSWAARGAQERQFLQELLAPWLHGHVEHVGSTAVPGLAAKPILDLQAPVQDLAAAEQVVDAGEQVAGVAGVSDQDGQQQRCGLGRGLRGRGPRGRR